MIAWAWCPRCDKHKRVDHGEFQRTAGIDGTGGDLVCADCGTSFTCTDCGWEIDENGHCLRAEDMGEEPQMEARCPATLREYRFTFGMKYADPNYPRPPKMPFANPDGWMAVLAPDALSARVYVIATLGTQWAFLYSPANRVRSAEEDPWESNFPAGELARFTAPARRRHTLEDSNAGT